MDQRAFEFEDVIHFVLTQCPLHFATWYSCDYEFEDGPDNPNLTHPSFSYLPPQLDLGKQTPLACAARPPTDIAA